MLTKPQASPAYWKFSKYTKAFVDPALMPNTNPDHYFTGLGPHQGYMQWLSFQASLQRGDWQSDAQKLGSKEPLELWLTLNPPRFGWLVKLPLAGVALLGFMTMVGALNYAGERPVNLWLLIGVFCFTPLLLTTTATITIARSRNHLLSQQQSNHPSALGAIYHILLPKGAPLTSSLTAPSWLMWQSQQLAVAFHVAAMAALFTVLFFNDVAFGWSSTIIKEAESVHYFFEVFGLPWAGLIPPPSLEAIETSQFFFNHSATDATELPPHQRSQWWPHLLFGMFFYGLAPRILLSAWLKHRTRKCLANEIKSSPAIQRFLNSCQSQVSHHAKTPEPSSDIAAPMQNSLTLNDTENLIVWQNSLSHIECKALGQASWSDDEAWLSTAAFRANEPAYLVVNEQQTPTAELADCISLINQPVTLLIISAHRHELSSGQLKSWQYFAKEQKVAHQIISDLKLRGVAQ